MEGVVEERRKDLSQTQEGSQRRTRGGKSEGSLEIEPLAVLSS